MANYCTTAEVKAELSITGSAWDTVLDNMCNEVKRFIDDLAKRSFDTESATKYFDGAKTLYTEDLISITTLKLDLDGDGTYETELSSSDYILYPLNGYPKTIIKLAYNSGYQSFAAGIPKGVEVAGTWGFEATVPYTIARAAKMQVCRWFKRKDSAYADQIGATETGQLIMFKGLDRDIKEIIKNYLDLVFA